MFLQFPKPVLGRTRSTRKNSVRVANFFGIGMRVALGRVCPRASAFRASRAACPSIGRDLDAMLMVLSSSLILF